MKRALVSIQILVLLAQTSAFAAYDGTVEMSDLKNINLQPFLRSQYLSKSNLFYPAELDNVRDLVLKDSENKISDTFQIPPVLRNSVEFWLRIYTEFSTRQVVLFDANHPEMIYEVVDLRPIALVAKNPVVYEIASKNKIQTRINAVRGAILKLAARSKSKKQILPRTPEEAAVLNQYLKLKHKHPLANFAKSLKAQTGQRDNVIRGLVAAEAFFPKMEEIFVQNGLPKELTRLCLVESSFNMFANSRVGAAGVWQFMPATAKAYMTMDQNFRLDERLSPLKSTVAAARLLKFNYKIVGSWPYAITAYNHGFRGLIKHKKISQTPHACALFKPCGPKMGFASRNYYAEFLALLYAETYKNYFYGEPPAPQFKTIKFHKNDSGHSVIQLAKAHDVPLQEFRFLNPDAKNIHIKLPKTFWVAVPSHEDDLSGITAPKRKPSKVRPRSQPLAKL
jgi:membrane-bound lytic murein transglycosylase D